jgi:phytoene dehydrogenase-like protein
MPVRRLAEERFDGAGGGLLLAGSALHADVTPDSVLSGLLGWLLTGIAQQHGWPVPVGGAGELTAAMVRRFDALGGVLVCGERVVAIDVDDSGACAVRTDTGERYEAGHGVLADVVAPKLYHDLLSSDAVPDSLSRRIERYQPGSATFKVNWTLDAPIPWTDPDVAGAGTVHLADSMDELTMSAAHLATGYLPQDPFILLGQMTTADPTRSPRGTESVWAYTDVPQRVRGDARGELAGLDDPAGAEGFAGRLEDRIERHAPGFRTLIRRRSIQSPHDLERDDANLINGDKNLGSAQLHQQLIFRPTLGLGRAETPIPKLFLASASAHPGGGVHGACGANAARAAIAARRAGAIVRWPLTRRWQRRS